MVKSMNFLSRGHRVKTRGGVEYVCLHKLSSEIIAQRWVHCPTNKEVSHQFGVWLGCDLKIG